jgi:hypothetical protein
MTKCKTKKLTEILLFLVLACTSPTALWAQDAWQLRSSLTASTGLYSESIALDKQKGLGLRMSGEKDQTWGFTVGLQSTRTDMQPMVPAPKQTQDDWLLSSFVHVPLKDVPGRMTFQLDAYKTSNNATQSISSDVRALAPQLIWQSYTLPLKIDLGYARSKYKNTDSIYQTSVGLALGFNGAQDWFQVRSYNIRNLNPISALGRTRHDATEIKFTHLFGSELSWIPNAVTVGLERGQKIYVIDVETQTLYNLPMQNEGGENITANWKISSQTELNMHWSKNKYLADQPLGHRLSLRTLNAQITKKW